MPSYRSCAARIVRRERKPSFLAASCCSVLVVNGAAGFFRRFALLDLGDDERQLPRPRPPRPARPRSRCGAAACGRRPWRARPRRSGRPWRSSASMVQYSCGLKRADLALALDDEPERDGLHPAGGEAGLDAASRGSGSPCSRPAGRECGAPAARPPCGRRSRRGFAIACVDGVLGDLVEQHAVGRRRRCRAGRPRARRSPRPRGRGRWRGRCWTRVLGRLLELGQGLRLALDGDVLGLEAVLDVDAELAGGQVAEVADGGLHVVAAAQVLADRLGLGGRLDDDERASPRRGPGRAAWPPGQSATLAALAPAFGGAAASALLPGLDGGVFTDRFDLVAMSSTMPAGFIAGSISVAARNPRGRSCARRRFLTDCN